MIRLGVEAFLGPSATAVIMVEAEAPVFETSSTHEDLLTIVKRRKLQWYGHTSHSSGLAKTTIETRQTRGRGGKTTLGNGQAWSSDHTKTS